ncbi:MAG: potassium transporter Kup [Candidatus Xenobia bacterium]
MNETLQRLPTSKYMLALCVGALGVVYGDIGTSPIYAMREALHETQNAVPLPDDVIGITSLIVWALTLIVSIKYLVFVMRANYHGEGGILALTALVRSHVPKQRRILHFLLMLGLFGTALLYGDGMLTPSISVLSAVEGLNTATPRFQPYIIPITVGILVGLFMVQQWGTEKVGRLFGPIMIVWFLMLSVLGLYHIVEAPSILVALSPVHGVKVFMHHGLHAFAVLGAVFLAVTGGEALYADLGHFGAKPIRLTWFGMVFPSLILCYLGQGALLLAHPESVDDPFFRMLPPWGIYPAVILATLATVIASQALISGAYSLTMQAVQLKFLPRLRVVHTSEHERGQIYVPAINWTLMVACILLVLAFQTSSNMAAAYGVAVTLTMLITSLLFFFMLRHAYEWPRWKAALLCGFFMAVEGIFFAGNAVKIPHGGWFPLAVGVVVYLLMSTWRIGRLRMSTLKAEQGVPLEALIKQLVAEPPTRVEGVAVFMHADPVQTPPALINNLRHNHVLHQRNVVVTVSIEDRPHVPAEERARLESLEFSFYRVHLEFGYLDRPDVPAALQYVVIDGRPLDAFSCTYFLARETILPRKWLFSGMAYWREKLFTLMARNAQDATVFFNIPPTLVMELGSQIEM